MNKLLALIFLSLFLAACQHVSRLPEPSPNAWALSGKASITTQEDSVSGNLEWVQEPARYRLLFSHPLASQDWMLSGSPEHVMLRVGQHTYEAKTAEELLMKYLHWALPLSSLPSWVRGQPNKQYPIQEAVRSGKNYQLFRQQGFLIEYLRYDSRALPSLMRISSPDITFKLNVHEWRGK